MSPPIADLETVRLLLRVASDPDTPEDRDRAWAGVEETVEGLRKKCDRLAAILAVERGDESKAPDGWHNSGDQWDRDYSSTDYQRIGREWCSITDRVLWRGYRVGTFPTALGAMEAADEARKESTTGGDDSPEGQP